MTQNDLYIDRKTKQLLQIIKCESKNMHWISKSERIAADLEDYKIVYICDETVYLRTSIMVRE